MKAQPLFHSHTSLMVFLSIAPRSVPKFMKRMKVPDYKEKSVFGVPLIIHVQRCGFPLPLCLQQALCHLRTHCLDQVRGFFFFLRDTSKCGWLAFKVSSSW